MRRLILSFLILFFAIVPKARAEEPNTTEILPDSSNFVIASILISSPGQEAFFALGHCGLRLQCPSENLDYCFSFSTIVPPGPEFNLLLLLGKMKAGYEALPYDEYLDTFRKVGRGVTEYPLNLTLNEKRELWRKMDNLMLKGPTMPFDFLYYNCTGTLYRAISSVLESEHFVFPDVHPLNIDNRTRLTYTMKNSPWLDFLSFILMFPYLHADISIDGKVYPELWGRMLKVGNIEGLDGAVRPALAGTPEELLPMQMKVTPLPVTPVRFFGGLLVLALLITLLQWVCGWKNVPKVFDLALWTCYLLFSFYLTFASINSLYSPDWNWFLVVFNPLPFLFWLCFRKKHYYPKFFAGYSSILIVFMAFLCLYTGHIEWGHELLLSVLLVRCAANYFLNKRSNH